MREARIILPLCDNAGQALSSVHADLKLRLGREFGGWTATPVDGGWAGPLGQIYEDKSLAYDVAVPEDRGHELRCLARYLAQAARQQCIYLRLPDGHVEFVEGEKAGRKAA